MDRRNLFGSVIAFMAVGAASALGKDDDDKRKGKGKGHQDHDDDEGEHRDQRDKHGNENQGAYFRPEDYDKLRKHYGGPANLPPGLRKKYARTGTLPPGWEKRFQPFPPALVQQLPPVPPYYDRGYIDGQAVVFDRRTRAIIDVINIVGGAIHR